MGTPLLAAVSQPPWPAGVTRDSDPRVVAVYQARRRQWAAEAQVTGQARSDDAAKCPRNATAIWPVGQEKGSAAE